MNARQTALLSHVHTHSSLTRNQTFYFLTRMHCFWDPRQNLIHPSSLRTFLQGQNHNMVKGQGLFPTSCVTPSSWEESVWVPAACNVKQSNFQNLDWLLAKAKKENREVDACPFFVYLPKFTKYLWKEFLNFCQFIHLYWVGRDKRSPKVKIFVPLLEL